MNISKDKLGQLRNMFKKQQNVVAVYVYGSRLKGYSTAKSDLDLAVVVDDVDKINYQSLYLKINQLFKKIEIDLRIVTAKSSPTYLFQVLKSGQCVYQRDEIEKVQFETKALKDFYDSQHLRDIYDRYLRQAFIE